MFDEMTKWLDRALDQEIPDEVAAFCFNLYEDGSSKWSMEIIGTGSFDVNDEDWGCDEVTDFETRQNCFTWEETKTWDEILVETIVVLKDYLENGKYAEVLKEKNGIGVGFVDGDVQIIYQK